MKRSPLKRKAPLRAKLWPQTDSALKLLEIKANWKKKKERSISVPTANLGRNRLAPRSKTNRKRPRNFPYMLWIKTLPCAVCGRNNSEAAHTGPRGLGQKAPDEQCIPLCPDHHRHRRDALDVAGPRRFQEIHGIDIKALVVRLQAAWQLLQDNPPITAMNPAVAERQELV
jgi:hypothetical protein